MHPVKNRISLEDLGTSQLINSVLLTYLHLIRKTPPVNVGSALSATYHYLPFLFISHPDNERCNSAPPTQSRSKLEARIYSL
jgi:hypothetical protein